MTIYLNPEIKNGLGEDTFWTWFEREFDDSCFGVPDKIDEQNDIILQYSTIDEVRFPKNTISLCWELYPEMKKYLKTNDYDNVINKTFNCAKNSFKRVVSTKFAKEFYSDFGHVDQLPIAVNTELFKPLNKTDLRKKYNIPLDKKVGFWMGTNHPMKGFENLEVYRKNNPDIEWIIVWKDRYQSKKIDFGFVFTQVSQERLAELMNCADFFLSSGILRPYFMVEWEAMSCNIPFVFFDNNLEKDFVVSQNPREDIFRLGWDRETAKKTWRKYIDEALSQINPSYQKNRNRIENITSKAKVSIVSLIYKSPEYADAVHDSLKKYTPILNNEGSEFFFIANDPSEEVINHLKSKNYKFYVNNNPILSERHLLERGYGFPEYINRVYRGWNQAILRSKNDIVVLINSDMMFSPLWLENLLKNLNDNTFVCSQLIEHSIIRGAVFPGAYDKFFGFNPKTFVDREFSEYSKKVRKDEVRISGAYMPCAFYKKNLLEVELYPEGNIANSNNFFDIQYYGDGYLIKKLKNKGINHITALDSIVYHFNEGEMRESELNSTIFEKINNLKKNCQKLENTQTSELLSIKNLIIEQFFDLNNKINLIEKKLKKKSPIKRLTKNIINEFRKLLFSKQP